MKKPLLLIILYHKISLKFLKLLLMGTLLGPFLFDNVLATNHDVEETAVDVTDPNQIVAKANLGYGSALPPYNTLYTDPAFNDTPLRRVTNLMASNGLAVHVYSQLQAFSSDNQYMLLAENGDYIVRRVSNLSLINNLDLTNINAPRWQPALSHVLVFYDTNEDTTIRVQYGNVDTGSIQTIFTFPSIYQRIRGNQSFDELSHDGRWMAGMAAMSNGDQRIFTLNLLGTPALVAYLSLNSLYSGPCTPDPTWGNVEPDWIGVSALGNYLVVQWARDGTSRCSGLEAFNIQTGQFLGHVYDGHQHGDLGVRNDQTEFFMTTALASPEDNNLPAIMAYDLPNGVNSPSLVKTTPWGAVAHISCQGPDGVCLVTSSDTGGALNKELYLAFVDGGIRRLTHHRSSECGYWVQPRASISRDGHLVIFDSDYTQETGGQNSCSRLGTEEGGGEVFLVSLTDQDLQSPNGPVGPQPPVARAGLDQTVNEGATVNLNGSSSTDPEGGTLEFSWAQTLGPTVNLQAPNSSAPYFSAPLVTSPATLEFELSVTDTTAMSDTDFVTVIVNPLDTDGDGLRDYDETNTYETDPNDADSDDDYLNDGTEVSDGTNPLDSDSDDDGMNDYLEKISRSDPNDSLDAPIALRSHSFNSSQELNGFTVSGSSRISWSVSNGWLRSSGSSRKLSWVTPVALDLSGLPQFMISFDQILNTPKAYLRIFGYKINLNLNGVKRHKKHHILALVSQESINRRLKIWVDGILKFNQLMPSPYTSNTVNWGSAGRARFDKIYVSDVPNPRIYPLSYDFSNGWGPFFITGDRKIRWKISNGILQARPIKKARNYGFVKHLQVDFTGKDVLLSAQVLYSSSSNYGGLWLGLPFEISPRRIVSLDSNISEGQSYPGIPVGQWVDVSLTLRQGPPLRWSLSVNGMDVVLDESIDGSLQDFKAGFMSDSRGIVQFRNMFLNTTEIGEDFE